MKNLKPVIRYTFNSTGTLIRLIVPGVKAWDGSDYYVLLINHFAKDSWLKMLEDSLQNEKDRRDQYCKFLTDNPVYDGNVKESQPYKEYTAGIIYLERLVNHAKYGYMLAGDIAEVQFPEPKQYQEG